MEEYTDDLALIVRYDGTKAKFETVKSNYLGKVVFIYGSETEVANQAGLVQAIWVSDANGGRYLDMANVEYISNNLTHISGITVDGTTYYPSSGGGAITLAGANGIAVTVNTTTGAVTFDASSLNNKVNEHTAQISTVTNVATQAKADSESALTKIGTLVGTANGDDGRSAREIAEQEAAKVKDEILGTSGDASTKNTIYGAKAYADTKDITIDSTNNDNTLAGKFVIKKNNVVLATINIPKELVVTKDGSEIVKGTWSGDTFTESETGTDKALKLAIQNQTTPIYINVADLVDVYTASSVASDVKISISDDNVISATITAVSGTKIIPNTIDKDKLADAVKESLNKADSAIVALGGDDYIGVENVGATATDKKITAKTAEITNETATTDGLATVADIRAYLAARLSVKVVS